MIEQLIIIKSHNDEDNIERCIKSVIAQKNILNLKLYIIDDASSDRTQDIIMLYKKHFFKMELRKINKGPSFNYEDYNKIIHNYSNGYVVILSGDDYFPIEKTIFHEKIFTKYDVGLHFGNGFVKDHNNSVIKIYPNKSIIRKGNTFLNRDKKIYLDLIDNNYIPSFAAAYSIKYLKIIGGFKCIPSNNLSVDFSTICFLSTVSDFYYSNQSLGYWIRSDNQQTAQRRDEQIILDFQFIVFFNNYLYTNSHINSFQKKILFYKSLKFKNYKYFDLLKKSLINRNLGQFFINFVKVFIFPSSFLVKLKSILILLLYPFPSIYKKILSFKS